VQVYRQDNDEVCAACNNVYQKTLNTCSKCKDNTCKVHIRNSSRDNRNEHHNIFLRRPFRNRARQKLVSEPRSLKEVRLQKLKAETFS